MCFELNVDALSMRSSSSRRPRTSLQSAPLPHRREWRRSGWHWNIQPPARRRVRSNPLHRDTPFSTSLHPLASPCCFISQRSCSYTTHHHACSSSYAMRLFCGGVCLTASTSAGGNSVPHTPGSNSGTCGRLDQGLSKLEVSDTTSFYPHIVHQPRFGIKPQVRMNRPLRFQRVAPPRQRPPSPVERLGNDVLVGEFGLGDGR
jgi:hypothetical protein